MGLSLILKAAIPVFGMAAAAAALSGDVRPVEGGWRSHFADADDLGLVTRGKQVYAAHCVSCHGRSLQGQPLWRTADEDRPLRAPALNETGPDWMRSDEELLATVTDGHLPSVAPNPRSRMPAFGPVMAQGDILAVVAFIKARWPVSLRVAQSALNPGGAGAPRSVPDDWRFPPICMPGETASKQAGFSPPFADPRR